VFDIETSSLRADIGSLRVACFAELNAHGEICKILTRDVLEMHGEKNLALWILHRFEEGDIFIGHNCMEKSHKVLTSDLRWVEAGSLKVGDKLLAFEEKSSQRGSARKIKIAEVTRNKIVKAPLVEVRLSNGDRIRVTPNHPWLTTSSNKNKGQRWLETKNFNKRKDISETKVIKFFDVWQEDNSYERGYLAGFFDGEGTFIKKGLSIYACQATGVVWDTAKKYLKKLEIPFTDYGINLKRHAFGKPVNYLQITGGMREKLRFLGQIRPKRFLEKFNAEEIGELKVKDREIVYVKDVVDVGIGEIAQLTTSTGTYFGEGYGMHNSKGFDRNFINGVLIRHKLPKLPKRMHIDTLVVAQYGMKGLLQSYSLENLADYFKLPIQKDHPSKHDWRQANDMEEKSIKRIRKRCISDVQITALLWEKLKPFWFEYKGE
jgi:hypothetical protein